MPPKGSVIGLRSRRARLQSRKRPSPVLVCGGAGQISVWGSTQDLPSTAGVVSDSDGSVPLSERGGCWGRRLAAHPGLSSSCLCQAGGSLSSVQCALSAASLPRVLGASCIHVRF